MTAEKDMSEEEFNERWKNLPESDRRFLVSMMQLADVLGDRELCFCEITPQVAYVLEQADRDTLFTIMTLCVGILTDAPVIERIARWHEQAGSVAKARTRRRSRTGKGRKPKGE